MLSKHVSVPDDLSLTLARLENRCETLEVSLRAESDAADVEAARAKSAEDRFQKLLAWARKEEGRRRLAEEKLATVREEGRALEARMGVVKNEVTYWKYMTFFCRVLLISGRGRLLRPRTVVKSFSIGGVGIVSRVRSQTICGRLYSYTCITLHHVGRVR